MNFHGIGKDDLGGAPCFGEVAPGILKALDGIMVGHSVEYDHEFLRRHFRGIGTRLKKQCLDIVCIEEWLGKELGRQGPDLSLDAIMRGYGLKESYRHNAMADAFCVAQIFQMQIRRLADLGIDSLWTLKQVVKSCRGPIW